MEAFAQLACEGKLFLNFSAGAPGRLAAAHDNTLALLRQSDVDPERIVIELTEQSPFSTSASSCLHLRLFARPARNSPWKTNGTANASMNLWVRLQPDVVKIDRFFIHDVASDPLKFEAVRAMQHFANASGAKLVAEGIKNEANLIGVRHMGIGCGQRYFFGRPNTQPARMVTDAARQAIRAGHIAVFRKQPARSARRRRPACRRPRCWCARWSCSATPPPTTLWNCSTAYPICTR
jgi:EAL domain-containing protein (putative c-di-GMP-specific phosphodiesterase class I)